MNERDLHMKADNDYTKGFLQTRILKHSVTALALSLALSNNGVATYYGQSLEEGITGLALQGSKSCRQDALYLRSLPLQQSEHQLEKQHSSPPIPELSFGLKSHEQAQRQAMTMDKDPFIYGAKAAAKAFKRGPVSETNREILRLVQPLIPETISPYDQQRFIKAFADIPESERHEVAILAQSFLNKSRAFEYPDIIQVLGTIPSKNRTPVVAAVDCFSPQVLGGYYRCMIQALGEVPCEDLRDVVSYAKIFLDQEVIGNPSDIIEVIRNIPGAERKNVIKNFYRITQPSRLVPLNYKILKLLSPMERQDRNTFSIQIAEYYGKTNNIPFLRLMRFIPPHARKVFIDGFKQNRNARPRAYLRDLIKENAEFKEAVFKYWHNTPGALHSKTLHLRQHANFMVALGLINSNQRP